MQLTKQDVVLQFSERYGWDVSNGLRLRVVDNKDNMLAPERYSYKLSFVDVLTGQREKLTYWPNTLGYQG